MHSFKRKNITLEKCMFRAVLKSLNRRCVEDPVRPANSRAYEVESIGN